MKQFFTLFLCLLLAASAAGQGLTQVRDASGKWGYVGAQLNTVIPCKYDDADYFYEGLARIELNGKYGFIDKQGNTVIPCKYDWADSFSEGLARVKLNGKWGFIDKQGNEVIPFKYDYARSFSEGLAKVELNGKYGFIDKQGNTVIPCKYESADSFSEGLALVELNGKYGFIDKQGNEVIPCKYDWIWSFSEGLAAVELKRKVGFIDKQGHTVIPCEYNNVGFFSEGLARVEIRGKWGYIDKQGNTVILRKYDDANSFSEGLAAVKLNGKWGYIDKLGHAVIPFKYDYARSFSEGLARVRLNDTYGYINTRGDWFDTEEDGQRWVAQQRSTFSRFARRYVEERINAWQKKGEFEKTSDWQARVNETTRNRKIAELTREAEQLYIKEYASKTPLNYFLGRYDADNEVYLITCNDKELLVPVPIAEAPAFKQNWESMVKAPRYFVENDRLAVAEVVFTVPGGKTYRYSNAASLQYTMAEVSYNFDPIEISMPETTAPAAGRQTVNRVTVTAGKSDVDVNIPQGRTTRDRTFAVIIANENYTKLSPVVYALNDGKTFGQYCRQTLGLPETNIRYYGDATYGTMLAAMSDIKKIASAYEGDIEVLFYYAGHGAPDEQQEAYLMPVDAYGVGGEVCYSLARLYKELGGLGARRVTVFLDACFSGSTREGTMLASARGVAIKPRSASPTGNMVVFTAAQGDETALPYRTQGHGLFTYYLLKKLQESGGKVTFGELGDYLTEQVSRRSQVVNRKSQTPAVLVSPSLGATWQTTPLVQ